MSGKIAGQVWDLALPHAEAWVLIALADHADHDGRNAFPGQELLAHKTGYSTRQIRRILASLEKKKIIVPERGGQGRGIKRSYQIVLKNAPKKPSRLGRDGNISRQNVRFSSEKKEDKTSAFPDQDNKNKEDKMSSNPQEKADISDMENRTFPTQKADISGDLHDKERARVNRHEPSYEPSEEEEPPPAPPFDNFFDPLSDMALAIATVMGLPSVPEGDSAAPINEAAKDFLAASLTAADVAEFERDFYARKNSQGKYYVLTLKILREDLPGWSRANRMRRMRKDSDRVGSNGATHGTPSLDPQPPRPRVGQWGQTLNLLDATIGMEAVAAWFEPLDYLGADDAEVRLRCADPVFRDWIERNYSIQLADALREARLGDQVIFEIGGVNG